MFVRVLVWSCLLTCVGCKVDHHLGDDCPGADCAQAVSHDDSACLLRQGVHVLSTPPDADATTEPTFCVYRSSPPDEHSECRVYWSFDEVQLPSGKTLRGCNDFSFLQPVDLALPEIREFAHARNGGTLCRVRQVSGPGAGAGWFFASDPAQTCLKYTPELPNVEGIEVWAACSGAQAITRQGELIAGDSPACSLPRDSARHASDVGTSCEAPPPERGFLDTYAYVETGTSQCATGACLVFQLSYEPDCKVHCSPGLEVSQDELDRRSYCSCRCDAPPGDPGELCECQEGFSCVPILHDGPPGVRGGYCVRNGTFNQ